MRTDTLVHHIKSQIDCKSAACPDEEPALSRYLTRLLVECQQDAALQETKRAFAHLIALKCFCIQACGFSRKRFAFVFGYRRCEELMRREACRQGHQRGQSEGILDREASVSVIADSADLKLLAKSWLVQQRDKRLHT